MCNCTATRILMAGGGAAYRMVKQIAAWDVSQDQHVAALRLVVECSQQGGVHARPSRAHLHCS